MDSFWDILFDKDEKTCYGNRYANEVLALPPKEKHEYFCINPLDTQHDHGYLQKEGRDYDIPRRADFNVSKFRNFMFEMDTVSLVDQIRILKGCGIEWTTIVYSGGKSYHAILSLEEPLEAEHHSFAGVQSYKAIWQRIAAYVDDYAGVKVIDTSSKNPSRLSRFPMFTRDNGNLQAVIQILPRIKKLEFEELLSNCPEVSPHVAIETVELVDGVETAADFWRYASSGLKNKLRYVDWADSAGLYPELYRITLWAIDETGIDKETFLEVLSQRTFEVLLDHGYPAHKLEVAVDHAYKAKRRG